MARDGDRLAVVGRLCQGRFDTSALVPECQDGTHHGRGDFGLVLLDVHAAAPASILKLGEPAGVMSSDIVATPVFASGQVFVAWAKIEREVVVLALASWTADGVRCEWTLPQPGAINPPVDIRLLADGDRLLTAFSRDGRVRIVSVALSSWKASCGKQGVSVHELAPIAVPAPGSAD